METSHSIKSARALSINTMGCMDEHFSYLVPLPKHLPRSQVPPNFHTQHDGNRGSRQRHWRRAPTLVRPVTNYFINILQRMTDNTGFVSNIFYLTNYRFQIRLQWILRPRTTRMESVHQPMPKELLPSGPPPSKIHASPPPFFSRCSQLLSLPWPSLFSTRSLNFELNSSVTKKPNRD